MNRQVWLAEFDDQFIRCTGGGIHEPWVIETLGQ
jgi:hypothetical protein